MSIKYKGDASKLSSIKRYDVFSIIGKGVTVVR